MKSVRIGLLGFLGIALAAWVVWGADKPAPTIVTVGIPAHRFMIYPGTNEAETATQLQQQGITKIEKYGSYWLGTGPAVQPQPQSAKRARSGPQIETVDHFNKIELNTTAFDVTDGEPALPAHLKQAAHSNKNLQIVQFKGPPLPEWLAQLNAIPGVRVIRYIPNNAYLVQVASAARQAVQNLANTDGPVQWIGAYHPYYKIQGDLLAAAGAVEINVGVLDGAEAEATLTTLVRYALRGIKQRQSATQQWVARLQVNANDLPSITQLPSVLWVQRYHPAQHQDEVQALVLANDTGGGNGYPVPLQSYENFLLGLGFSTTATEYPVLDICDTGIDQLSPYCTPPCANVAYPLPYITWHPAFSYPTLSVSPDEATCNYPFGVQFRKVYDFSGADDTDGHGTIVASVACGYDNLPDEPSINCLNQTFSTNIVTNITYTVRGCTNIVCYINPITGTNQCDVTIYDCFWTNIVRATICSTNDPTLNPSNIPPPPWYSSRTILS